VLPLVNSGAVVGREPAVAGGRGSDQIELPPASATMDDCCRIAELLLGAAPSGDMPLTVGILAILSNLELSVAVVYTATPWAAMASASTWSTCSPDRSANVALLANSQRPPAHGARRRVGERSDKVCSKQLGGRLPAAAPRGEPGRVGRRVRGER